ncbi:hypothetical protein Dxin01_00161 [Deinococcus xinjiangensis]|uniref:Uncharacterized protein n=1 Tax=Deinococcus xinjiangensis TaxID=457454 RepID=A0ABP9V7E6_9DEIO
MPSADDPALPSEQVELFDFDLSPLIKGLEHRLPLPPKRELERTPRFVRDKASIPRRK